MTDISIKNTETEGNGLSGVIISSNSEYTSTSIPGVASQPVECQTISNEDVIDLVSLDDDDLEQIDDFYIQTLNSALTRTVETKHYAHTNSDGQQRFSNTSSVSQPVLHDEELDNEENEDSEDVIEIIDLAVDSESTKSVKSVDDQSSDESENMYLFFAFFYLQ